MTIELILGAAISEEAETINRLIKYFAIAASFVFLVVACLLFYVCVRFRGKPGDPEPKQTTGNIKIEALAVGLSIALVVFFLFLTVKTMREIEPGMNSQTADVIITGHQWWWEVSYPGTGVTSANEVHLPAGKKLLLEMRSADVIHDWSIPGMGPKIDLIPGKNNHLWLTIIKPGIYLGQCNEFCGIEHARMHIRVIAQSTEDFQQWLAENEKPASAPADTMAIFGASLFQNKTCSSCHRIRGTDAVATVGPDLTHMASRKTLVAGIMINDKANLLAWITDPQKIKPGAHMPDFLFKKDTINAIAYYLSELK